MKLHTLNLYLTLNKSHCKKGHCIAAWGSLGAIGGEAGRARKRPHVFFHDHRGGGSAARARPVYSTLGGVAFHYFTPLSLVVTFLSYRFVRAATASTRPQPFQSVRHGAGYLFETGSNRLKEVAFVPKCAPRRWLPL